MQEWYFIELLIGLGVVCGTPTLTHWAVKRCMATSLKYLTDQMKNFQGCLDRVEERQHTLREQLPNIYSRRDDIEEIRDDLRYLRSRLNGVSEIGLKHG